MNKIYWLTGLPCSGKTTIAKELAKRINAEVLDGDDIRANMHNPDFSYSGRKKHMLNVAWIASLLSKHTNVVVSLVSPIREVREQIKERYSNVIEIFVQCSLKECERRDVKGMYKKARAGEIKNFTGIDAPYEEPPEETTFINTEILDVEQCLEIILQKHHRPNKYSLFIGRWQCLPPHAGHLALFDTVRQEGKKILIGIRDTEIDDNNPYSVQERMEAIKIAVPDAEIVVIPDIEEVVYGRGVGYGIRELHLEKDIEAISATKIRGEGRRQTYRVI